MRLHDLSGADAFLREGMKKRAVRVEHLNARGARAHIAGDDVAVGRHVNVAKLAEMSGGVAAGFAHAAQGLAFGGEPEHLRMPPVAYEQVARAIDGDVQRILELPGAVRGFLPLAHEFVGRCAGADEDRCPEPRILRAVDRGADVNFTGARRLVWRPVHAFAVDGAQRVVAARNAVHGPGHLAGDVRFVQPLRFEHRPELLRFAGSQLNKGGADAGPARGRSGFRGLRRAAPRPEGEHACNRTRKQPPVQRQTHKRLLSGGTGGGHSPKVISAPRSPPPYARSQRRCCTQSRFRRP